MMMMQTRTLADSHGNVYKQITETSKSLQSKRRKAEIQVQKQERRKVSR